MDYRDILRAQGHTVQGERCELCWDIAISRTKWQGGNLMENYRAILVESKEQAMKKSLPT